MHSKVFAHYLQAVQLKHVKQLSTRLQYLFITHATLLPKWIYILVVFNPFTPSVHKYAVSWWVGWTFSGRIYGYQNVNRVVLRVCTRYRHSHQLLTTPNPYLQTGAFRSSDWYDSQSRWSCDKKPCLPASGLGGAGVRRLITTVIFL